MRSLTFSPDGNTLISTGEDQAVHLRDRSEIEALDELGDTFTWAKNDFAHSLETGHTDLCPSPPAKMMM